MPMMIIRRYRHIPRQGCLGPNWLQPSCDGAGPSHSIISGQHRGVRPRLAADAMSKLPAPSNYIRVQVLTPEGVLNREKKAWRCERTDRDHCCCSRRSDAVGPHLGIDLGGPGWRLGHRRPRLSELRDRRNRPATPHRQLTKRSGLEKPGVIKCQPLSNLIFRANGTRYRRDLRPGRAIALQLAGEGADVIVHGRDAVRGAETVEAITEAGGKARFIAADLSDLAELRRLAQDAGDMTSW